MLQMTTREKRSRIGRGSASLRLVQRPERESVPAAGASRPTWAALYVMVLSVIAVLFGVDIVLPKGPARTGAQLAAILGAIGLVWIWLRCNRALLARTSGSSHRA
jgi:hypothetical protein